MKTKSSIFRQFYMVTDDKSQLQCCVNDCGMKISVRNNNIKDRAYRENPNVYVDFPQFHYVEFCNQLEKTHHEQTS